MSKIDISPLPNFSDFKAENISTQITTILQHNRQQLTELLEMVKKLNTEPDIPAQSSTWREFLDGLDAMGHRLHCYWSQVSHLHAVTDTPALREAVNQNLPQLTAYYTEISHNSALCAALQKLHDSPCFQQLSAAEQKSIQNDLRDFKLSGVDLSAKDKQLFKELSLQLSQLSTEFSQNVLDATDHWFLHTTDQTKLSGLPQHAIDTAKQAAEKKDLSGWVFTLQAPSFIAVMTYADHDEMREAMYTAYVTRASDQGPDAGRWNNGVLISKTLQARQELAQLLGFSNYAEYSLATKMAGSCTQVIDFLEQLSSASQQSAKQQYKELCAFAQEHGGPAQLEPWQIGYYSEKLRQSRYAFSSEDLRPYFPLPTVLTGLFDIAHKLYNIDIRPVKDADVWHPDVTCYAIYDNATESSPNHSSAPLAYFYLDPYAREHKRGGAWMDDYQSRQRISKDTVLPPIAFLVCNLTPAQEDSPALLNHDEVVTIFHEFGHGLHHMLTKIECPGVAGINGVAWDAVELPSQFMENWAYDRQSLDLFAKHFKSGSSIPADLFKKMQQARNFQAAMQMLRQVEFSLFDFKLHMQTPGADEKKTSSILTSIRKQVRVTPTLAADRFQNSFSHIFAGGYAAGYYSYKWAEVMAADAFSLFKKDGLFNQTHSKSFLKNILQAGGSESAAVLFERFRGRAPDIQALLEQEGISQQEK